MKPVLVLGDLTAEIVLRGLSGHPGPGREVFVSGARIEPGGTGARVAAALTRFGRKTAFVAKIGRDELGSLLLRRLKGILPLSGISRGSTPGTSLRVAFSEGDDASLVTYPGSTASLKPADLRAVDWRRYSHFHLASPFQLLGLPLLPVLKKARAAGLTVSLSGSVDPRGRGDLAGLYPLLHLLLLTEAEIKAMGVTIPKLAEKVPLLVVRRGLRGAVAATQGGVWKTLGPALGPVFDAAFLDAWLDGHRVGESLSYASAASSLAEERGDALGATPTRAEALHQAERRD